MTCPSERSERLDRQLVRPDERAGLGPVEDAGGGADGSDATGADGAGQLQAFELGQPFDQAGDVAGVERVAPAGAVDVVDRVGPQAGAEGVGDDDRAGLARVTTTRFAPRSRKASAWRTGSDSPRINVASSVLGRKTSVKGRTGRRSRR